MSISAKSFWAFVGLVTLALTLFVVVFSSFFGHPRSADREFAAMKQRVDPHMVQAWAKLMLKEHTDRATLDATMTIPSSPPGILKAMAMFGRMGPLGVSVSAAGPNSNRCVALLYVESPGFGGDGHIIEAGDESFRAVTNAQCFEWIPGVYYRCVHSP